MDLISRQDAIDVADAVWSVTGDKNVAKVWDQIKDLPSAQPEQRQLTEDDYAYCAECDHVEMCRWYPMYGCEFKSRPYAQPERMRGKWIKMSDADGDYYVCDQCGEELPRYTTELPTWDNPYPPKYSIDKTNFCSNCGADMRGRDDE